MIVYKVVQALPIRSSSAKLIIGSIMTSLAISLGMVGVLSLLRFPIHAALPAVFASIGAAIYAARTASEERT